MIDLSKNIKKILKKVALSIKVMRDQNLIDIDGYNPIQKLKKALN